MTRLLVKWNQWLICLFASSAVLLNFFETNGQQQQYPQTPSRSASAGKYCFTQGCTDAGGKWMKQNPIPADKAYFDESAIVENRVQQRLKCQLEANDSLSFGPSSAVDMTRKFYKTCTDIETLGRIKSKPLYGALTCLGSWPLLGFPATTFDLSKAIAALASVYSINPLWSTDVIADANDASRRIFQLDQVELNLDAKDVYSDGSNQSLQILKAYQNLIERSATLIAKDAGLSASVADIKAQAEKIIEFEKKLANLTKRDEERRNLTAQNNMWTVKQLKETVKVINWDEYFDMLLPADVRPLLRDDAAKVQVAEPAFFRNLNKLLTSTDPKTLANFVVWNLVWKMTSALDERFLDIKQEFDRINTGRQTRLPKWMSCTVAATEQMLLATGALFVDKHFGDRDKAEVAALVANIIASYESTLQEIKWMDQPTKQAAVKKLRKLMPIIGFPDVIRTAVQLDDYYKDSTYNQMEMDPCLGFHNGILFCPPKKKTGFNNSKISEQKVYSLCCCFLLLAYVRLTAGPMLSLLSNDSHFEMQAKMASFEKRLELRKLTKPVDRSEFGMSPAAVNAYYDFELNTIVLPAAILEPIFFRGDFPKAYNYGSAGSFIGHELTHGFDDKGSQYDEVGNVRNWWTNQSAQNFAAARKCMINQYSSYKIDDINMTVNGANTIGENIADNGGINEAFSAYKRYTVEHGDEPLLPGLKMSNDQVFFTAFAQSWCANIKPQELISMVLSDVHSPPEFRVNGPLFNSDDFAKSFNCQRGSRMNPVKSDRSKCEVW